MKQVLLILLLLPIFCNAQNTSDTLIISPTLIGTNYPIKHCDTQKVLMLISEKVGNHAVYSMEGFTVHSYKEYPFYTENDKFEYFFGTTSKNMYKMPEEKVIWECRNVN